MISPDLCSSLLKTGHEAPSALTKSTSSFVLMILNVDAAGSMALNRGMVALYRFGGVSVVVRSTESWSGPNSTLAVSLLIFLRKNDAMTVRGVW
jgi:hypothetical protein